MHPDVAALAEAHALPPHVARAVDALLARHQQEPPDAVATVVHDPAETFAGRGREPDAVLDLDERYEDLGRIGIGGMGEVRRVHDRVLDRTLAMKTVRADRAESVDILGRFLEEAKATAQLQHPHIVPIHDLGRLPDGRLWFTMREVQGRTLRDVLVEVHEASADRWRAGPTGWSLRRMITAFLAVCNAVAHAHDLGIVHRDLKPDNVMVGELGEVYVLDWGLALRAGRPDLDDGRATRVLGSPAYMPPEQARGQTDRVDARSDVYALGATLYELLSGRPPYEGEAMQVLLRVQAGPPAALVGDGLVTFQLDELLDGAAELEGKELPPELVQACERAMAREPSERFPSATDLAEAIRAWLDGDRRRDHALEVTEQALAGIDEATALRERADRLEADGASWLEGMEGWRSEQDKAPGWALQDQAAELRLAAELEELEVDQGLTGALRIVSDLPEAHAALALRHRARHVEAEAARVPRDQARAERLVRAHVAALPEHHEVREACEVYLRGDGALTLLTDPPGAEVTLQRYELRHRRWVEGPPRSLGRTPLHEVSLPMGSYLCVLRHPGRVDVRYPIHVPRQGHWDGIAPGEDSPTPIYLPPEGTLGPDDVLVPAGWFHSGGDPEALNSHPARRLWCDALVVQRFPVTNRAYLGFLDDLVAHGQTEDALRHAPRERPGVAGEAGALVVGFDGTRFSLQTDAQGDTWLPDFPVFQVDWHGAQAYLAWLSERTGTPWRLPGQLEWEKAARGVDGRWFPWGDRADPSWCCLGDSHRDHPLPVVVDSFPVDRSPHGVRGMAGNVRDWCLERMDDPGVDRDGRVRVPVVPDGSADRELRVLKGGDWFGASRFSRVAYRFGAEASFRYSGLGFRGVYRWSSPSA